MTTAAEQPRGGTSTPAATRPTSFHKSVSFKEAYSKVKDVFHKSDSDNNGTLNYKELQAALSEVMMTEVTFELVQIVCAEFDKDRNGVIDVSEFAMMIKYLENVVQGDISSTGDFATQMQSAIVMSKKNTLDLLADASTKLYPFRDILCVQENGKQAKLVVAGTPHHDDDFDPAFAPSEMRCLALVSHNEMKATMKKFVIANKNILKKFRLTGTNSTMTMLKEVFKGESNVIFGPSCQSGPLGGDAELVSLMCSGRLGGMLFFQDPMSSHPHQADIDCLVRQALVHNTFMANTPTSALMMMNVFREALKGEGKPEWMPSFFFTLQSPAVSAYKAAQTKVIQRHASLNQVVEEEEKKE